MQYWLMKSEPDVYSIDKFKKDGKTLWTSVRNYQARNYMMEPKEPGQITMTKGDLFLFYHSNAEPSACVGIGRIENVSVPDPEQFIKKSEYYEPRATKEKPVWFCAECRYVKHLTKPLALQELKADSKLKNMLLLKPGSRLSVQPVEENDFKHILKISGTSI